MPSARSIPNLVPKHENDYPHASLLTLTEPVTYYVNAATGDDENDGLTAEYPFATIGKAISVLPETILATADINIAEGVYPESLVIDKNFRSGTQQGYLNFAGDPSWEEHSTATIVSIEATDYGQKVTFDRSLTSAESGMRGVFTDGNMSGSSFFVAGINPIDDTQAIITQPMGAVTSRAVSFYVPKVSITGDGMAPLYIAPKTHESYGYLSEPINFYDLNLRDSGLEPSISIDHAAIYIENCLIDGINTLSINSSPEIYAVSCSFGAKMVDFMVTKHSVSQFDGCAFGATNIILWESITGFTNCTLCYGGISAIDNCTVVLTSGLLSNSAFNCGGKNCTVSWLGTNSEAGNPLNFSFGNGHTASFSDGAFTSPIYIAASSNNSMSFSRCTFNPTFPAGSMIDLWDTTDATHNTITFTDCTYSDHTLVNAGPIVSALDLSLTGEGITTDSSSLNIINILSVIPT